MALISGLAVCHIEEDGTQSDGSGGAILHFNIIFVPSNGSDSQFLGCDVAFSVGMTANQFSSALQTAVQSALSSQGFTATHIYSEQFAKIL